jgi:hypothetical protein
MKRKFVNIALFLPLLACLMGADTINWGPGQPVANPGGALLTIEGSGPYALDPGSKVLGVVFWRSINGSGTSAPANWAAGNWDCTVKVGFAGTYDVWGELSTINGGVLKVAKTPTTVKLNVN